jgi:hypothetical protein
MIQPLVARDRARAPCPSTGLAALAGFTGLARVTTLAGFTGLAGATGSLAATPSPVVFQIFGWSIFWPVFRLVLGRRSG